MEVVGVMLTDLIPKRIVKPDVPSQVFIKLLEYQNREQDFIFIAYY